MYLFLSTASLLALALTGVLPRFEAPAANLALYLGIFALFGLARAGLYRAHRASARARFVEALRRFDEERAAFEDLCRHFEARHRPPKNMWGTSGQLDLLSGQLDEADPLLLWPHIDGHWHTTRAIERLRDFNEALSAVSDAPMGFKTGVQQERERSLIDKAHTIAALLTELRLAGDRHGLEESHATRFMLGMACVITALWAHASL